VQVERVAAGEAGGGGAERRGGRAPHRSGDELGRRRLAERPRAQALGQRVVGELVQGEPGLRRALEARGQRHQHRQLVGTPDEVGQPAQARRVGPVGIVDQQRERLLVGEIGHEPVQAVVRAQVVGAVGHGRHGFQHDGGMVGGALGQRGPALGIRAGEDRLEQLAGDPVGNPLLELARAGAAHEKAAARRALAQRLQQRALAAAGRAFEHREDALPARGAGQAAVEPFQVVGPFQQHGADRKGPEAPAHSRASQDATARGGTACGERRTGDLGWR
jgi:hypothetical protein